MVLADIIKILFVVSVTLGAVPLLVYFERKISAGIQSRIGPNRVGPLGLFQPLADAVKLFFKEDIMPGKADRLLYTLGPILAFVPSALVFAVIPFGKGIVIDGQSIPLQIADLNIGVLFVLAFLSVGIYGIMIGGWASNSVYSFLGALRACSQMIAYELTLGLAVIAVIMMTGSVSMAEIVERQTDGFLSWNIVRQPLAFLLFFIAALAENNRLPFDLAECESELVGGYHTEYSSMKFALFFMGEYLAVTTMSALITTFFLGGWSLPGIVDPKDTSLLMGAISTVVFFAKVAVLIFIYMWIRWTLPRFRYDQLMNLGWKSLLPLAILNLIVTAAVLLCVRGA